MTGRRARTPDIGVGRSDLLRRGVRSPVNGRNRLIPLEGAKALTSLGFASLRARLELASLVEAIFISRHEPKDHLNSLTLAVLCGLWPPSLTRDGQAGRGSRRRTNDSRP